MHYRPVMILLPLGLLLLSACSQSVPLSKAQSPTLAAAGPNMQEVMEQELRATGSWTMPPSVSATDPSELRWSPSLTQSNQ